MQNKAATPKSFTTALGTFSITSRPNWCPKTWDEKLCWTLQLLDTKPGFFLQKISETWPVSSRILLACSQPHAMVRQLFRGPVPHGRLATGWTLADCNRLRPVAVRPCDFRIQLVSRFRASAVWNGNMGAPIIDSGRTSKCKGDVYPLILVGSLSLDG